MGGIRNSPTYLYQNESGYHFRIAIPYDIRRFLNKTELRRSIHTGTLAIAKQRARAPHDSLRGTLGRTMT